MAKVAEDISLAASEALVDLEDLLIVGGAPPVGLGRDQWSLEGHSGIRYLIVIIPGSSPSYNRRVWAVTGQRTRRSGLNQSRYAIA